MLAILGVIAIGSLLSIWYVVDQIRLTQMTSFGMVRPSRPDPLREVVIEDARTRNKILVIDIFGVISSSPWDYLGNNLVTHVEDQLEKAAQDDDVRAVILKIDSPGGEVLASDEIYKLLMEFQEEHGKPVIGSMGTLAASGGYYVAAPCQWIVANELTITGSIGVIMHSYNWRGLMDKVGVRPQVFKSGELKDMLSPDKPVEEITAEERRIVQNLVNQTFERFKHVVEEGRRFARQRNLERGGDTEDHGRTLAPNWVDYADGRLLSGTEAWELGFVDELGNFGTAVERALRIAEIEDARLVQYLRPLGLGSLFRLFGQSEEARVELDLGLRMPRLEPGLYFIAPTLIPAPR